VATQRRNQKRRPARSASIIEPKPRILVVCEGQVTEVEYVQSFCDWCKNPLVHVSIVNAAGVPLTLVKRARQERDNAEEQAKSQADEFLRYERVFCVFDIDDHPHVPEAKQLARDNGLEVAISNPCFDLWLLLHLRESPGMLHRHAVQSLLAQLMPAKRKHVDFEKLSPGYEAAFARAERLDADAVAVGEHGRNPTTGVYRLTAAIKGTRQSGPAPWKMEQEEDSRRKARAAEQAAWTQAEREQTSDLEGGRRTEHEELAD